jgi:alkylated DNA nucleotide flippase Atl1
VSRPRHDDHLEPAVVAVIRAIPRGQVVTYGEVAAEAGYPGAARAVGRVLATSDGALPWWRVVTATGRLVPGHEREHARRLRDEGVAVHRSPARVALARDRSRVPRAPHD